MVMVLVSGRRAVLRQLDSVTFNAVNLADLFAVGTENFHVFLNVHCWLLLGAKRLVST
jgi:hypothetical protein